VAIAFPHLLRAVALYLCAFLRAVPVVVGIVIIDIILTAGGEEFLLRLGDAVEIGLDIAGFADDGHVGGGGVVLGVRPV
jgi:hypothetical protein